MLSLELGSLKRAVDSGRPYAAELDLVRKAAGGSMDLSALERNKDTGVPTLADLERSFRPVMNGVIDAAANSLAAAARGLSGAWRGWAAGNVQGYALSLFVGVVLVLLAVWAGAGS